MNVDKVYIINLDRNKDRFKNCSNMLNKLGGIFSNFERLPAVDGSKLDKDKIYNLLTISSLHSLYNYYHLDSDIRSVGAIGCYLSHYKIWKDIIKNNYQNVIVFEDDAYNVANYDEINNFITSLPEDFDIAFFNYHNYSNIKNSDDNLNEYNQFWCTSNDYSFFHTDSYIISNKGAAKLLEKALPISQQVDAYIHVIATLKPDFKRYFSKKKLFKQNSKFDTTIQDECFKCKINRYVDFLSESEFKDLVSKMKIKENFYGDYYDEIHNFDEETNFVNNKIIENFINEKLYGKTYLDTCFIIKFVIVLVLLFLILKINNK